MATIAGIACKDVIVCTKKKRRQICRRKLGRFFMKCPFCGYNESKVIDSRPADEGSSIRRRRECLSCAKPVSYTHLGEVLLGYAFSAP